MDDGRYRKGDILGTKNEKKNSFLWHLDFKQPMEHKSTSIENRLRKMESHY